MVNYIIRRLLIMIPTLFGITVMVFGIARCAPGRPGAGAFGEGGQQDAEGQKKMREWYEKRYGLNLPMYQQYFRWWRGLFYSDREARAWTSNYEPLYTYRTTVESYYAIDPTTGTWYVVSDLQPNDDLILQTSPDFGAVLGDTDHDDLPIALLEVDQGYPVPGHIVADCTVTAIDPLDADEVVSATDPRKVDVKALAWTYDGRPVYLAPGTQNPSNPETLIYERDGRWFELTPDQPVDRWTVQSQDDPAFNAVVTSKYLRKLPEIVDGRPIPRHVIVRGKAKLIPDAAYEASQLTRMTADVQATLDAWQWTPDGWPILKPKTPISPKIYQAASDGQWYQFFGATRVQEPDYDVYRQDDEGFLAQLSETQSEDLPTQMDGQSVGRHVVMSGASVPLGSVPTDREIRRYSHTISVLDFPLGNSLTTHTTVRSEIQGRILITLGINALAFPIIYIIAIPTGMMMALKRGKMFDHGSNVALLAMWSVPYVLTATLAIGYLAEGGKGFEWFPTGGLKSVEYEQLTTLSSRLLDRAWHLILPIGCIVYGGFAYLSKQMRAAMLENFTMDYVRTARAKGVSMRNIVIVHVLRNSLIPIITIFATILPALIAGSVILEKIFNIEGMGMFAFRAVTNRDYDVVQTLALIFGVLNLTGLLLADIVYAVVDPRITYN
ncbi:MAG: ABC transporter permease subunit [Planctomycetes bacterium]|nr:ABC transporter permease subunit [Planctomycetota bacterium]NOG52988.1 ABC transporter permease subunit [Planctomycetota bacterium]